MRKTVRLGCVIGLAGAAWAAPETQTFPVTVSNAVSGKLETVPVTFRCGATNGLVERFDGARFVPVTVKPYDFSQRALYLRKKRTDVPEWNLCSRLEKLVLPAQSFEPMPLSNAAERVAQAIRRQGQDAAFQMRVAVWLPPADFRLPAFSVPATNALGALRVLTEIASEAAKKAPGQASASLPITFAIRGADTVILRYDDDVPITRAYPVPHRFWEWFLNEDEFGAYVQKRLQTGDWGNVQFLGLRQDTCDLFLKQADGPV